MSQGKREKTYCRLRLFDRVTFFLAIGGGLINPNIEVDRSEEQIYENGEKKWTTFRACSPRSFHQEIFQDEQIASDQLQCMDVRDVSKFVDFSSLEES